MFVLACLKRRLLILNNRKRCYPLRFTLMLQVLTNSVDLMGKLMQNFRHGYQSIL
jgi:hypothetical protein